MIGKLGLAPCGHLGEHIIGNYVACFAGCGFEGEAPTNPGATLCPNCGSHVTEPFELDPLFYQMNPDAPIADTHCVECGTCWAE